MTTAIGALLPETGPVGPQPIGPKICMTCRENPVGRDRMRCDRCKARDDREDESRHIREITSTGISAQMPDWDWARVGRPDFESRVHKRMRNVAEKYDLDRGNLHILGKTGDGKTGGLVALAHRFIDEAIASGDRGHPAVRAHWTDAYTLVASVRRHKLGVGLPDEVQLSMDASLLFLDELGHEPAPRNEKFDPIIWEVLNARYAKRRPTLVTSGFRKSELEDRYGKALIRRIVEPKGATVDLWEGQ